jgi:hypothetical protein
VWKPARRPIDRGPLERCIDRRLELAHHGSLVRLRRVQLETEFAEPGTHEPAVNHLERRHFLGDEQDGLSIRQRLRELFFVLRETCKLHVLGRTFLEACG